MAAIANRYAKALVDVSFQQGLHETVRKELVEFHRLVEDNRELLHFYTNPAVPLASKKAVTGEILGRLNFSQPTRNFIFILLDNYRINYLAEIVKAFHHLLNERMGVVQAEVTMAAGLDRATQDRLVSRLEALTGKKVVLQFQADPLLLGGVITRIGDTIYDGSVRQQLELIKARLSAQ